MPASDSRTWPELVVTAAVLGVFAEAVFTAQSFFTRDIGAYELPLRKWWRDQLLRGEFPEWIPNMGLGIPVVANPVSQALYPFNLMMLLPLPQGLDLYVVAHLIAAGLGAAQLARRLGSDATGACVAGLTFALGGYLVSMTTNPFYVVSDAYIPWIVVAMLRVREQPASGHRLGVLALLLGLQLLAGAFQGAMFSVGLGVAIVLFAEPRPAAAPRLAHDARVLAAISAAVVVAALVAAAQLLPALRFAAVSTRGSGIDLETVHAFSTHPLRLLNVFVPGAFGLPFIGPYYASHLEQLEMPFPWAYSLYSGAACWVLLPMAFMHGEAVLRRRVFWLTGLLLLTWVLALGVHTPAYELTYRIVPLLDKFRFPEKLFSLASLLAALLAGLGVTALLTNVSRVRQLWPALLCLALPIAIACLGALAPDAVSRTALDPRLTVQQAQQGALHLAAQTALSVGVAVIALACLMRRRRGLFLLVHVVDLFVAISAYHRTTDLSGAELAPELAARVEHARERIEPMRLLTSRRDFINTEPVAFERVDQAVARPNRGVEQGLHIARPFTSAEVRATKNLTLSLEAGPYQRTVRTLAVTSVVSDAKAHRRGVFADYDVVARWGELLLLDVPDPLPRAHVVFRAASVKSDEQAVRLMTHPHFPSDRVAVFVDAIPKGVAQLEPPEMPPAPRPCRFTAYEREHVAFECELDQPGVAVLADQFVDGWELEVNSMPREIQRVDVAYRGVTLPAGKHRLVYRYRTPGLMLGALVSGFGVVLLGLCFALSKLRN